MNEKMSFFVNKLAKRAGIDDAASFENKLDLLSSMDLLDIKKDTSDDLSAETAEKNYNQLLNEQFSSPIANVSV